MGVDRRKAWHSFVKDFGTGRLSGVDELTGGQLKQNIKPQYRYFGV
jgi:hypothetical protein